jgi:hypothetical protein
MDIHFIVQFFESHQAVLWLATIVLDLGSALLLYYLFGKQGLYATIVISLLLANVQGP